MHHPPHPGDVLRDGVVADTRMTVTEFAQRIGVTRAALSRVLNGSGGISDTDLMNCRALEDSRGGRTGYPRMVVVIQPPSAA
jgi:addiction module HigA family antidote